MRQFNQKPFGFPQRGRSGGAAYAAGGTSSRQMHLPKNEPPCGGSIDCGRGTASVRALYDTGNGLTDAFTGSPVAVVNAAALEGYLPDELATALRRSTEDRSSQPPGHSSSFCESVSG